ncbi:MAG: M14 metallopeptidase family protein [Bryobacteraceae bacterium]
MRVSAAALLLAAALALPGAIPDPAAHFGHPIGADRTVLDWDQVVSYFRALEKNSDQIRVEELGKTVQGRPFIAATIARPETLRNLGRYRDIQKKLADPRRTPESEVEALVAQGKTVVLITCSIHATEIASTHTAVEFAWRLLTENKPRYRAILDNTIFILVPSLNPDGVDIVTRWYRKTLGTPYEGVAPPELYHHYVGHDNNRDWYIFSQPETRHTISRLHNVWHPQIVYDVHQQGPYASRMFVPPWLDPIEPNIDAILVQQCNRIGLAMAADLTAAGKTGVAVNAMYDFWTPARHYQAYHAGMRILSESASARIATPITVKPEQLDRNALGYSTRERSWNHLEPWTGGQWRLRDIIDYQLIAWESCLYEAAIRRDDLLRNFYRIGKRAVERQSPYGFFIPSAQRDPGATKKLLDTLRFGLVEIEELNGGHLIRMAQPYGGWAKALLERQQYPDLRLYPGGPPKRPYDVTSQTLPLLMGVAVQTLDTREAMRVPQPRARVELSASDTDTWQAVNLIWKSGGSVWRRQATGDFAAAAHGPEWKPVRRPRVGLYKSHMPSMDEGWTRWLFDEFQWAYSSVGNVDLRAGNLNQRFDVLVFPDQPVSQIADGYKPGTMPPEFTGGLGPEGEKALKEFAANGGTLIFFNRSTAYALERLGVKAKNVLNGVSNRDFYSPGSLLNVQLADGPLTLGLPKEIAIWSEGSPAWETGETTVARYPEGEILASGWLLGGQHLAGRSALVHARVGRGNIVLFGMRPQYRAQSYLTFKLVFNALLL